MAWRRSGDKPLSEPMTVSLLTHICVTRPQWVNYILDETLSTNPIHYIETAYDMHQLIDQQEWMIKPPLCWMSFLHPIQYFIVRVQFLNIHPCSKVIGFFCNVEKWYLSSKHRFASLRVVSWGVLQQPGKISKYFVWCMCLSEVSKVRKMWC